MAINLGIWNIQAADLATGIPTYLAAGAATEVGLPAIPRQALFTREDIILLATASGNRAGRNGAGIEVADLDRISLTALADAKAVIAGEVPAVPPLTTLFPPARHEGVHVCPFNYGFILRSRNPEATQGCSDVLRESPLLSRVRQLVYQRPSRQIREELDESSRLEYNALKAFLTTSDRDDFLALFPEFRPRFALYDQFVAKVIRLVLSMLRDPGACPPPDEPRSPTKIVAQAMLAHILSHRKDLKADDEGADRIVHDFVVRPNYAALYLRAIGLPPKTK